ncbi:MAG: acetylglutamate kinase [Anaerolineae bacterium]
MIAPLVIKIGGHESADPVFLQGLAEAVRDLHTPVVIVHGGGAEISTMQQVMGITPQYVDGVRVTDAPSLAVVEMVLCGVVNKRLVRTLVNVGVEALGLSGVDQGIVRAVKMQHPVHDMGLTGAVTTVRGGVLHNMLAAGVVPVMAPLCLGEDQPVTYNVNADHVAGAVAAEIQAARVVFLTNVEAVLVQGEPVAQLNAAQAEALINDGTITGGMIPKVKTALDVVAQGVGQAVITNLTGLRHQGGTVFVK